MHTLNRRQFLHAAGTSAAALALAPLVGHAQDKGGEFELPKLPYSYDALEPYIDAETMKIHHDLHHKAYVDNLNKAVAKYPELKGKSLVDLLRNIKSLPKDIQTPVINNGGGHYNHSMFWNNMAKNGGRPSGELAKALDGIGGVEKVQKDMSDAAINRFGSGWAWLILGEGGKLLVTSTPNQNSPVMEGAKPLLGLDVWEHAYYLKYRNRRAEYVKAWWNVVNWTDVSERYAKAMKQG
jgi:Fe-Mn family superoxide dismutase